MNTSTRTTPAYDSIGSLDVLIYAILGTLGLSRDPLRSDSFGSVTDATNRNARRFTNHFGGRAITAIKTIRDHSGFSLNDAVDAWHQILDTYGDRDYLRAAIAYELKNDNPDGAQYYLDKFHDLVW